MATAEAAVLEEAIIRAFHDLCAGAGGCAPIDVARLLHQRGELPLDTDAVGVASVMRQLRTQGRI